MGKLGETGLRQSAVLYLQTWVVCQNTWPKGQYQRTDRQLQTDSPEWFGGLEHFSSAGGRPSQRTARACSEAIVSLEFTKLILLSCRSL